MRVLGTVLFLVLAGCMAPAVDPLSDRGELAEDMAAPAPTARFSGLPQLRATPEGALSGQVTDSSGAPLRATLWPEVVDLREPVENRARFVSVRAASMVRTDADGRFDLDLPDAAFSVMVSSPGYRLLRVAPEALGHVVLSLPEPLVVAHRGASFYAPENSLASLQKAALLGANFVEADVRIDASGRPIILHDATLDRTTSGRGNVSEASPESLASLDAGGWLHNSFSKQRVSTLTEFLSAAEQNDVQLVLDVKATHNREATWAAVIETIEAAGAEDRVVFASFRQAGVKACQSAGLTCALLSDNATAVATVVSRAVNSGASWLMLDQIMLSSDLVAQAHDAGLHVHGWTANDSTSWERLLALGVDSISTDRPGFLVDFLNQAS